MGGSDRGGRVLLWSSLCSVRETWENENVKPKLCLNLNPLRQLSWGLGALGPCGLVQNPNILKSILKSIPKTIPKTIPKSIPKSDQEGFTVHIIIVSAVNP